jgi:hypothetical protein
VSTTFEPLSPVPPMTTTFMVNLSWMRLPLRW